MSKNEAPSLVTGWKDYPEAYALFLRTPGMFWRDALVQSGSWTPDEPPKTSLATEVHAETERFSRAAAIRERATRLIELGQDVATAEHNATRAVAYERGEPDLDSMTLAELRERVGGFDMRELNPNNQPAMADTRTKAELLASLQGDLDERDAEIESNRVRPREPERTQSQQDMRDVWAKEMGGA